ncbi:hypothetical protein Q9L58_008664 [Maublancomyces gigas]|uniref:Uncharacterized protein n=1 Tax=Discina gigas TaxID=1032678 RepID=A0ABR3G9C3_9PEZI
MPITWYEADYNLYNAVAVIFGYGSGPPPGPALATKESLHVGINSYKCYLCNPADMAFAYLNMLNSLFAPRRDLQMSPYCMQPSIHTIGGLVQHIETRSCRCMADSNWWTTYFILTETNEKSQRVKENPGLEVRLEVVELLELYDYWVDVYGEMTGDDGCWVYKRSTLRSWPAGLRGS